MKRKDEVEQDIVELNCSFKNGDTVRIEITGHSEPLQVVKALERLGRFEYLQSLYASLAGVDEDEEFEL